MEHRWGERLPIEIPVQLRRLSGAVGAGTITNASGSGAFIRTSLPNPPLARIDILIDGHCLAAFAVRNSAEGVGVEWCEWMPEIISALLLGAHDSSAVPNAAEAFSESPRGLQSAR